MKAKRSFRILSLLAILTFGDVVEIQPFEVHQTFQMHQSCVGDLRVVET